MTRRISCIWALALASLSGIVPRLLTEAQAQSTSGPMFSSQVPTSSTVGSTFFVFFPLVNTGGGTGTNVQITSVTVGSAGLTSPTLPIALGALAPNAVTWLDLQFDGKALVAGQKYALTLRGSYESGAETLGFAVSRIVTFGIPSIFQVPANPLHVTPQVDTAHAATSVISAADGGTMTVTGADGTIFTLTLPPNALLSDEQITMTPVTALGGLPNGGTFVAGVEFQPEGLILMQAATLTITPPPSAPATSLLGYGYHNGGDDFHLVPITTGPTVTVSVPHFSGTGYLSGNLLNEIGNAMSNAIYRLEDALAGCGANCAGILQEFYDDVIVPTVDAAVLSDAYVAQAVAYLLVWDAYLRQYHLTQLEPFNSEYLSTISALANILPNAFGRAFERCSEANGQDLSDAGIMVEIIKLLNELHFSPAVLIPNYATKIAACVVGPLQLDMDSTVAATNSLSVGEVSLAVSFQSHVTAQALPLQFDVNALHYHGNGPLTYQSFKDSVQWPAAAGTDCSAPGIGNPGTVDVIGEFDVNVLNTLFTSNTVILNLTITPSITETLNLGAIPPEPPGAACVLTGPFNVAFYDNYLAVLHLSASGGSQASPYFVPVNSSKTFNFSVTEAGSAGGGSGSASASENTTLTLSQTSP